MLMLATNEGQPKYHPIVILPKVMCSQASTLIKSQFKVKVPRLAVQAVSFNLST